MIEIPDSQDECDYCQRMATLRVHILFLCDEHALQLAKEINERELEVPCPYCYGTGIYKDYWLFHIECKPCNGTGIRHW